MKKYHNLFSSFFYLGFSPVAPGTVGTLGGVFLYLVSVYFKFSPIVYIGMTLILLMGGVWSSNKIEKELEKKDPSLVVIDEVVGFLITMAFIPLSWHLLLIGFVVNRVLDILKPFPANWAQRNLSGGWGIMLDDVISSFYAHLILRIVMLW